MILRQYDGLVARILDICAAGRGSIPCWVFHLFDITAILHYIF